MFLLRLTLSQGLRKTGRHILSHKQTNKQPGRNEPYSQLCWKFLGKILVLKKPGLFTLITVWLYPQQVSSTMPLISHWFPSPYHIESKEAQGTDLAWCPISCPHFPSPFSPNSIRPPHSSLVCFLLQLYFGFLAYHERRKGRNHVYLYLVTVMFVPNTDIETWLMLNKYLLGKDIFVDFQENLSQITHHWKELEVCCTGPGHYLHGFDVHSTLVPPELSLVLPTSLIFCSLMVSIMCLWQFTVSTRVFLARSLLPSSAFVQLLPYWDILRYAQTYFFNNNFSPFLNKGGKFLSPNAWWKSPFGCGFHLKLNTPSHAHSRMEPMLVSLLGTMQGPSFHRLRLTFFGIVFEFLPLLKSWLILSL